MDSLWLNLKFSPFVADILITTIELNYFIQVICDRPQGLVKSFAPHRGTMNDQSIDKTVTLGDEVLKKKWETFKIILRRELYVCGL